MPGRFATRRLLAALTVVLLAALPAWALMIAPSPLPLRVAAADAIVIGKVTGFADKLVKAEMFKGDQRDMQIAKVKVEDTVLGKGVKEIQVGFFPPAPIVPGQPRIGGGRGGVQLMVGQEALLFLTQHPTKKGVYTVQMYYDVVGKQGNPNFANEVTDARKYAKALANPTAGLESKDADERFLTASLLLTRYRTQKPGMTKTEAIPAKESKLILEALAKADWNSRNQKLAFGMNPQAMFFRLGLTAKDGWTQPKNFAEMPTEAKKWLEKNADKYRIQRYVSDKKEEPDTEPSK